jgi:uncharacterized protein YkwD
MIAKWTLCAAMLLLGAEARAEENAKEAPAVAAPAVAAPPAKDKDDKVTKSRKNKLVPFQLTEVEENIVKKTNAERAKFGLVSLEIDRDLMQSARQHAKWMAQNSSMVHTSRPVAENIAMGQANSTSVLQSWMNSSGHRANILNRGHRKIGVALFRSASGTPFWCQQFRN